jgi:hypothetical protein
LHASLLGLRLGELHNFSFEADPAHFLLTISLRQFPGRIAANPFLLCLGLGNLHGLSVEADPAKLLPAIPQGFFLG